jgi:hypothetical protein
MKNVGCSECYTGDIVLWRELLMNETIKEYAQRYVSDPKIFHKGLTEALDEWRADD